MKVPVGQAAQPRSAVTLPVLATWVPAGQWVHSMQRAAFSEVLKVPLAQAAQLRSAVAVASLATYWPALQVVLCALELAVTVAVDGVAALFYRR
ncbi:MAG: hypothetical protein IPG96_07535 [Proteobacteria bacterium]|nr:hypothetical protein [Pseudomonadota bacterium]